MTKQPSSSITRRTLIQRAAMASTVPAILTTVAAGETENRPFAAQGMSGCQMLPGAQFYVAIDSKGLWPNLTKLDNRRQRERNKHQDGHGAWDQERHRHPAPPTCMIKDMIPCVNRAKCRQQ